MLSTELHLIDTSVLILLARDHMPGRAVQAQLARPREAPKHLISIVSVGELYAMAVKRNWGDAKIAALVRLLDAFEWVNVNDNGVLPAYASIDARSESLGRQMGKNDIWNAASAHARGVLLVTSDRDFDHLHPTWLTRVLIDPLTGTEITN